MTWHLKRSCIFGHWIQPPIIFEVKFVLWILQVSCSARRLVLVIPSVCLCLSVRLSVSLSPTGHNSKPIVIKLYQVVDVVSTEKPIDFEVKGQRSSSGQISKIVIFHLIDLKFEQVLHFASLDRETNYFWGQKVKGQLKVKLKSSISIWKIINFHLIDLSFD